VGPIQVLAARLHFDQQDAGPEQVDVAGAAAVLLHRVLEAGNALVGNAEDLEEGDQEGLALRRPRCQRRPSVWRTPGRAT